jgi:hypothetical protein
MIIIHPIILVSMSFSNLRGSACPFNPSPISSDFMESKYEDYFPNNEDLKIGLVNSYCPQLLAPLTLKNNKNATISEPEIKYTRCSARCVSGTRKNLRCKRKVLSGSSCCVIHVKYMTRPSEHPLNEGQCLPLQPLAHFPESRRGIIENKKMIEFKDAQTQTSDSEEELPNTIEEELWIESIPSYII